MTAVKKLTLGLLPEIKVFRMTSIWGLLVDALIDARGRQISDTYFTQIAEPSNNFGILTLTNDKDGNSLQIDKHQVIFTKSAYPNGHVKLDETFAEFKSIWNIIQGVAKLGGIRRIGIVAEHRFEPTKNNNTELVASLTRLAPPQFPAHFSLHYENRILAKAGEAFDVNKSAFINLIYDFYDSSVDTSFPAEGKINANIDYQKYYTPSLDRKITEEMEAHFYAFKKELEIFDKELVKLGLKK